LLVFGWRARRWRDLDRKGRLFVVCGNLASVVALVLAIGGSSGKLDPSPRSTTTPATPRFRYTVTDLGTLGGDTSRANGINNNGQVVGQSETIGGIEHPFLWDGTGGMQDLGGLGKGPGSASAINDAGQVVGESCPQGGGLYQRHAFLWEARHGMQDLGTLGGIQSQSDAYAINKRGQVVGESWGASSLGVAHAFLWEAGRGMLDLGTLGGERSEARGINDNGQVVGQAATTEDRLDGHAFLWEARRGMKDLGTLGGATSRAHGVNNSGQVVGEAKTGGGNEQPFLWDSRHGMQDLGTPRPADNSISVSSINNAGVVVGLSYRQLVTTYEKGFGGFIYEHGRMTSLDSLIDPAACREFNPTAINDLGQIAGNGINHAAQVHAFLLTPNPSPQSPPQSPTEPATSPQPTTEVPAKPEAPPKPEASASQTASDFHTWTYTTGRTVRARFAGAGKIHVTLTKEDGKEIVVRLDNLKREDRKLAERLRDEHKAGDKAAGSPDERQRMAQPRVSVHSGPGLAHDMQMAVPGASIHSNSGLADDMQMAVPGASVIHSSPPPP
jgi:probable HAF family extracellular repeat protein